MRNVSDVVLVRDRSETFRAPCPWAFAHETYIPELIPPYGWNDLYERCDISKLTLSPSLIWPAVATIPQEGWDDPYLPIGTPEFENTLADLDRIAIDVMVPELDTGFSLPVFLAELIELKPVYTGIIALLKRGPQIRQAIARLGRKPLRKTASDTWLGSVFGWIPFVRDVQTIMSKTWKLGETISEFNRHANKRLTYHFQRGLSQDTFRPAEWFSQGGTISTQSYTLSHEVGSSTCFVDLDTTYLRSISDLSFHATLEYRYSIPKIENDIMKVLRPSLEVYGVKLSLSDIWEVVPFSFVVDWLVGIGPWIEKHIPEVSALPVQVVIYDYCRSVKYRLEEHLRIDGINNVFISGNTFDASEWTIPHSSQFRTRYGTGYYRVPGVPAPSSESNPFWRTPKGLQWVSALALAAQRVK